MKNLKYRTVGTVEPQSNKSEKQSPHEISNRYIRDQVIALT